MYNHYETGEYPETHVIAIDEDMEVPEGIKIDLNVHANKVIYDKVNPLLDCIEDDGKKYEQRTLT